MSRTKGEVTIKIQLSEDIFDEFDESFLCPLIRVMLKTFEVQDTGLNS